MLRFVKSCASVGEPHKGFGAGPVAASSGQTGSGTGVVQLIAQLDRIIRAIHDSVPEELWDEILHKIDGPVPADIATDDIEGCEDADEYGPLVADGNSCTQCARGA